MKIYEIVQPFKKEGDRLREEMQLLYSRIENQELDTQRSQQVTGLSNLTQLEDLKF